MAKRPETIFYCKDCGNETPRWEGRCPACGEWNTLVEAPRQGHAGRRGGKKASSAAARPGPGTGAEPRPLKAFTAETLPRLRFPLNEFDRVLGGGAVPGGSLLVGGEPGIGKSTLLLQALAALAAENGKDERPLLYVSGEEAPSQIAARGLRIDEQARESRHEHEARYDFNSERLQLAAETNLEAILDLFERLRPCVAVIDSVQTLRDAELASPPGALGQVRECTMALVDAARRHEIALFLIGHVTREGTLAGPKTIEHVVDAVLSFEGDTRLGLRCLRALKNRFGSVDEVGLFEMTGFGLREVPDPSRALLDGAGEDLDKGPGTAVGALSEGSRILLVEVQALTVPAPGGGSPRRRASGLDPNRLAMLLAVLETKAGVPFGMLDVFASAAGGLEIDEPASDLPLALALASVATSRPVRGKLVAAGEVGLGGELRPVARLEARLAEARRLGFNAILVPARGKVAAPQGLKLLRAANLKEALALGLA
ncbi:MAG: DNA repair protein RadA [Planctomycetota bacterium]|nr:DNA repair protein RadA [Planctomycetota bacterium]